MKIRKPIMMTQEELDAILSTLALVEICNSETSVRLLLDSLDFDVDRTLEEMDCLLKTLLNYIEIQ